MSSFPDTRPSLVARVQNAGDEEAWREFVGIYQPVVYRLARKRGLQHADAEDLTQRVFVAVTRAIGSWEQDAERGRFRSWLGRIARNAIINALTRQPPVVAVGGTSILELLQQQPDKPAPEQFEWECRRSLFRRAAERVRQEFSHATWQAFWQTTVAQRSVEETASALGKSPGAVYAARSRVMRRLKREIEKHECDFLRDP